MLLKVHGGYIPESLVCRLKTIKRKCILLLVGLLDTVSVFHLDVFVGFITELFSFQVAKIVPSAYKTYASHMTVTRLPLIISPSIVSSVIVMFASLKEFEKNLN